MKTNPKITVKGAAAKQRELIAHIHSGKASASALIQFMSDKAILVRANAVLAVVREKITSVEALATLENLARRINEESPVLGTMSCASLAAAALKWIDTPESTKRHQSIKQVYSPWQLEDLERLIS